jgi:hypothetical protein
MLMPIKHEVDELTAPQEVTASEIACFSYCAKAWHLQYVAKAPPTSDAARRRDQGVREHASHGSRVQSQSWLNRHARSLVVGLLLIAALAMIGALLVP